MNTVKRRWPDLLIGLLVLLLLAGFAALLLGKNGPGRTQTGAVQSADAGTAGSTQSSSESSQAGQTSNTQTSTAQTPGTQTSTAQNQATGTSATGTRSSNSSSSSNIPTIPAAPVTSPSTATNGAATTQGGATQGGATQSQAGGTQTGDAQTTTPTAAEPAPRSGGAVATSENRTPTRNDYRISLGSFADASALQATTAGVSKLGYTVYPIAVASGVVAQVGPFATREEAAQALADIQRALPRALLYPPRNAPTSTTSGNAASGNATTSGSDTASSDTSSGASGSSTTADSGSTASAPARTPTGAELAATGPVYLQVGAYNSTTAAQTAVARVRDLGLEPSVNAPAGKLVTVVVGPFEGRALTNAEAKLQAGGIDSFRVR